MQDQDIINEEERHEAATEEPTTVGISAEAEGRAAEQPLGQCPSLGPGAIPSGADGTEPGGEPDYEMLARELTRDGFDSERLAKAIEALASEKPVDYPTFYTPGWLCEIAKWLQANGADKALTPEEQSARDREIARKLRKIHWTVYPTKVDVCAMGKTEQNGKVYEVRISKRGDSKVQDTYGQCKVNGKTVLTCSFTGSTRMLTRILTAGMQALVNYKAKRKRDSRRNYAKRRAANQDLVDKELA